MSLVYVCVICALVTYVSAGECPNMSTESCRENLQLCDRICVNGTCEIRALVMLPNSTDLIANLTSVCM